MIIDESLYQQIIKVMPIPCVDLIVEDNHKKFLLLKRKNEPAKGEWWFPGGRVMFGESRLFSAKRILLNECGLFGKQFNELCTCDLLLPIKSQNGISHGITTVFHVYIDDKETLKLDDQSDDFCWKTRTEWLRWKLHVFIKNNLERQALINYE